MFMKIKKAIILANGIYPKKSVFKYLQKSGYTKLICADGGANSAYKLGLVPDYIIGDLDSVRSDVAEHYKLKSKIIKYKRQDDTDVEKCLKFLIKKKYDEVILLGATGDRLDHSFCNLGIVLKFFGKIKISILHQKSFLKCFAGEIELKAEKGEIISIYGIDKKTKIKSAGLKYPLEKIALPFGEKESTSNVAKSNKVNLKIKDGKIFVIRNFNTMKKNGFFQ